MLASTEITCHDHSIIACSHHTQIGVVHHAHPVRGESHIQCNINTEVETTSPPLNNEQHRSHVRTFFLRGLHLARPSHHGHSTTLLMYLHLPTYINWISEFDSLFSMRGQRCYSGLQLLEIWSRQGIWEVTLYRLLPLTLASHLIRHNGNIYQPLTKTATCLYHNQETNISQKTVCRSVRQWMRSLHYSKNGAHARLCEVAKTCTEMWTEKCTRRNC